MERGVSSPSTASPLTSSVSSWKCSSRKRSSSARSLEGHDQARFARVVVAQVVKLADVFLALALDGGGGDGEQLVGGLAHGGDHHDGAARLARLDDAGDALDGGGGLDGGAAELHDDH